MLRRFIQKSLFRSLEVKLITLQKTKQRNKKLSIPGQNQEKPIEKIYLKTLVNEGLETDVHYRQSKGSQR